MNDKDIINILKSLKGEVDAPIHRTALRRVLLSQHKTQGTFAALQGLVRYMSMKKYYIPAASFAVVALFAVMLINPTDPQVAQAQEHVKRAFTRAIQISPEMRAQIEAQMKADMLETLKEAQAAPDLRILSAAEYEKEAAFTISKAPGVTVAKMAHKIADDTVMFEATDAAPMGQGGATFTATTGKVGIEAGMTAGTMVAAPMLLPVKYLVYTDPEGRKTALGLDENDTPVFKVSTLNESDVIKLNDGSIGIQGKVIKMMNVETQ